MKKILFLADGSSAHTIKWVRGLHNLGLEISLFSLREVSSEITELGIDHFSADTEVRSNASAFDKSTYLKVLPRLKAKIKSFNPDLIHVHYATSYGLLAFLSRFKPYVVSVWGSDILVFPNRSPLHKFILKQILKRSKQVFSSSELMLKELKSFGLAPKSSLLPFGIDLSKFYPKEKPDSNLELKFLIVKSLEHTYGIDIAIKAFKEVLKEVPDKSISLNIVGDGTLRKEYEALAGNDLNKGIHFLGRKNPKEIPEILNQHHVFINISRSESFGVSVLEASACGLPVIVSNKGGLPETMLPDKTGKMLSSLNTESCKQGILHFINHPEEIKFMGDQGVEFVKERFSFSDNLLQQKAAYEKILS